MSPGPAFYHLDYDLMTGTSTVCKLDVSSSVSLKSECDNHAGNESFMECIEAI
jgi:hypothetical protein